MEIDRVFYKKKLLDLYNSATGEEVNFSNISDIHKMVEYFYKLDLMKEYYKDVLDSLNVKYDDEKSIEVGVGPVDAIFTGDKTTIVTPYKGLFQERNGKTYEGSYVVRDGEIEMIEKSKRKFELETSPLEIGKGRIYLTHNIIHPLDLNSWFKLSKNNPVVVGIYGFQTDLDKDKKKTILKEFARRLDDVSYNSGSFGNCYCEAISSKPKQR